MTRLSVRQALDLARSLACAGRHGEADEIYRRVLQAAPDSAEALHGLGLALGMSGHYEEAARHLARAAALDPALPGVHGYAGDCLMATGRPRAAAEHYRRELSLRPQNAADFLPNFAKVLWDAGRVTEAVDAYRRAVALHPSDAGLHSNLLFVMQADPATNRLAIRDEHRAWAARHADPLAGEVSPHANDRTPGRRLRVGYVATEFGNNVLTWSLLPILEHHDRDRFEIACYADTREPDEVTERVRRLADLWRDAGLAAGGVVTGRHVRRRSDATLAEQVRLDRIDVLVDLTQHSEHNRLLAFARKPAPVQVTYLGYNAGTGLAAMDYRLTDPYMDPPGEPADGPEELLRLPNCYWAYRPASPGSHEPVAPAPPLARNGFVTFGAFHTFPKINAGVVAAWARIFNELPTARLLLVLRDREGDDLARTVFQAQGVATDRVHVLPRQPLDRYFRLFNDVDLTLDPFPYNGGITNLDSLWIGVPFVTLAGDRPLARAGLSILSNVGLGEWVARDVGGYVDLTLRLARSAEHLTTLRGSLRGRLRQSPLMDERRFTRDLESLYATAWERWRATASA